MLFTKKGIDRLNQQRDNDERLATLDWLTKTDYRSQQNQFAHERQEGTAQWFLTSSEFDNWLSQEGSTLFCQGMPGAGKTILTSAVIEHLQTKFQNDREVGIAYVYCDYKRQQEQSPRHLLLSLLRQLCEIQIELPESVKSLISKHKAKQTSPPLSEITQTIRSVSSSLTRSFIIVDAIDECQEAGGLREVFLKALLEIQSTGRTNIFITSRYRIEIIENSIRYKILEVRASEGDVRLYVEQRLSTLPSFITKRPGFQQEIKTAIVEAVNGM